jgi:hypothetical protein
MITKPLEHHHQPRALRGTRQRGPLRRRQGLHGRHARRRHSAWPSASSTRTACRDAIPRSIPTSRLCSGWPSCISISTSPCFAGHLSSGGTTGSSTIGHGPRAQEPANGSQSCAATGPRPAGPGPPPSCGSSVARPAVAIKSARPGTSRPQNLSVATYRTSRGCSCNPGTPALIERRAPYMNLRPLGYERSLTLSNPVRH